MVDFPSFRGLLVGSSRSQEVLPGLFLIFFFPSHFLQEEIQMCFHASCPGHERGDGANNRDEPRYDYRLGAMLFVESFCLNYVIAFKKQDAFFALHKPTGKTANKIVCVVAQQCRNN